MVSFRRFKDSLFELTMNYEELATLAEMTTEEVKYTLVDLLKTNRTVGILDVKRSLVEVRNSIASEFEKRTVINQKNSTITNEIASKYGFDVSIISYTGQGYFNIKCLSRLPPNLSEEDKKVLLSTTRFPISTKIKFITTKGLPREIGKGLSASERHTKEIELVREWKCTHSHYHCPKEVEFVLLTGITPSFNASIHALNKLGIEVEKCPFNSDRYTVYITN